MTKREMRDERRAARQAAERAELAKSTQRKRLARLGGAFVVAAVAIVIAVVATSSGDPKPVAKAATASTTSVQESNGVLGDPNAKYTVTEYLDFQCPICKEAAASELPTLIKNYVDTGKVKLQARTLHFLGDDSTTAAKFAAGAQAQGKFWPFLETFYANQGEENSGYVTDDFLKDIATNSGVDYDKAKAFAKTSGAQQALDTADSDASAIGADSTPTFTLKRGDGKETVLTVGPTGLIDALNSALSA